MLSIYPIKKYIIWFIILLALVCRLYHINFPVGGFQAWRQADTAAVARNFYENGFHFLTPQIDWGGNTPGYVEMELPLYPFLASLCNAIFFPSDIWGRLLSVLFALVAIHTLYRLVKKTVGEEVALWSALLLAILPVNMFYTRAFMPESLMLMSSLLGVYYFSEWMDCEKNNKSGQAWKYALLSVLFISIAALEKIVALYLGLPLLFLALQRYKGKALLRWQLWLYASIVVVLVVSWYYHAHQVSKQSGLSFGIWDYGSGKWGNFQPLLTFKFYNDVFFKSIAERHMTYAAFIPFVIGLFIKRTSSFEKLFDWWLIAVLVYFCIVTKGNQVHEYYQLPFTIPAVVFVGKMFHKYLNRANKPMFALTLFCVIAIPVLSFLRYNNYMEGEKTDSDLFRLGNTVQQLTMRNDLVVTVDANDPIVLYRCDRKGWHATPDDVNESFLQEKKQLGAKYLVGLLYYFDDELKRERINEYLQNANVVVRNDEYFVVRM